MELLSEIFSHLAVREFLTASEVCHTFNSIINSKVFLRKISFRADFTDSENFEGSTRDYVNLKIVNATNNQLKIARKSCSTHLFAAERLKLNNIVIASNEVFMNLVQSMHNLRELHIEGISKNSASQPVRERFKLPHLKILKFFYSTNDLLQSFSEISSQLEVLKLCLIPHENNKNRNLNYEVVSRILENSRTTLRKLNLYEVNFNDQFLNQISSIKFERLAKFSMSFNSYLSPESPGFERFVKQQAATLEKFKIRTFDHINEQHLKTLVDYAINIKSLNLIICSYCDYDRFSNFENLRKLEKLKIQPTKYCSIGNLSYKKFVCDKILRHRNENMKHLSIEMLPLTFAIVQKIILSFPNLITLRLSTGIETELEYAQQLRNKLKSLKRLILIDEHFID